MSDTAPRTPPTENAPTPPKEKSGLSFPQVIGGSLAAATAAAFGTKLGVAGTIAGAAIVSVVSAVTSVLYAASLRRTHEAVVRATALIPGTKRTTEEPPAAEEPPEPPAKKGLAALWSMITWKSVAVLAAVIFVIGAIFLTLGQLATGNEPTVKKVVNPGTSHTPPSKPTDTPTKTPSKTPSVSPTPTPSPTETPTPSPTPSPTDTPTPSPTATPTGDAAPQVQSPN